LIFDFGNVPTVWYLFSFFGWHFITRHYFHLPLISNSMIIKTNESE
jgi:hypothetical protein